jgi:hypothetical protein
MSTEGRALTTALHTARWAREALVRAALEVCLAERNVGEARGTVRLLKAEHDFDLAARNCVSAIDDLPEQHQPKGWTT